MPNHGEYDIEVFDLNGNPVGVKQRKDIDKRTDIFRATYVILVSPGRTLALTRLAQHPHYPRLYPDQWGVTCGTVVRRDESSELAAIRALENDLFLNNPSLTFLGKNFEAFSDGVRRWAEAFYCLVDSESVVHNPAEIRSLRWVNRESLERELLENAPGFAPSFIAFWRRYALKIPI